MNYERRIAALEAFACTKPREFDAFQSQWEQDHPEIVVPLTIDSDVAVVLDEKPKGRRKKAEEE